MSALRAPWRVINGLVVGVGRVLGKVGSSVRRAFRIVVATVLAVPLLIGVGALS